MTRRERLTRTIRGESVDRPAQTMSRLPGGVAQHAIVAARQHALGALVRGVACKPPAPRQSRPPARGVNEKSNFLSVNAC
jgi:hypothetical protein